MYFILYNFLQPKYNFLHLPEHEKTRFPRVRAAVTLYRGTANDHFLSNQNKVHNTGYILYSVSNMAVLGRWGNGAWY